jgi:hypothetical protein
VLFERERYTIAEPEEEELSSVVYGTNVNDQSSNEVVVFFWTPAPETFLKKKEPPPIPTSPYVVSATQMRACLQSFRLTLYVASIHTKS